MVEKLKKFLEKIESVKGKVILLAVMKMDDLVDQWSVFICADWISEDKELRAAQFKEIITLLNEVLTEQESLTIARVGMYNKEEYIPQLFLKYKSDQKIENEQVNGFKIHEAYIIKSDDSSVVNPVQSSSQF